MNKPIYVRLPNSDDVYEWIPFDANPDARFVINRSRILQHQLFAMQMAAKPINEAVLDYFHTRQ